MSFVNRCSTALEPAQVPTSSEGRSLLLPHEPIRSMIPCEGAVMGMRPQAVGSGRDRRILTIITSEMFAGEFDEDSRRLRVFALGELRC